MKMRWVYKTLPDETIWINCFIVNGGNTYSCGTMHFTKIDFGHIRVQLIDVVDFLEEKKES